MAKRRTHGQSLGRGTRRWRQLREELRARARAARWPCFLCGQPIDYDLLPGLPGSFTVDHVLPWSTHPALREDPSNLVPAHERCNKSKGDRPNAPALGRTSRDW